MYERSKNAKPRYVLTISQAQVDVIRDSRRNECATRLAGHVRDDFPADAARLGERGVQDVVELGMARSRGHNWTTEREMYLYITLMFMLGSSFDEDPQLPWATKMIADGAPAAKLHERALTHLDQVAGEENEHLVRALVRARAIPLASLPPGDAADFEARTVELLDSLYPTKFAAQSATATLVTLQHAAALAPGYQLGSGGAAHLAVLAFLLGAGFDRDPVHPWLQEVLREPLLGGDGKTRALHQASHAFLEHALK